MTTRASYINSMKQQLDDVDAGLSELEKKAQAAKEDARAAYNEELRKLRHQSKLAMTQLDALKAASEDSWNTMVGEMDKMRDAFMHSFHYFKSQV